MKKLIALAFFIFLSHAIVAQTAKPYKYQEYIECSPKSPVFNDSASAIGALLPLFNDGFVFGDNISKSNYFELVKFNDGDGYPLIQLIAGKQRYEKPLGVYAYKDENDVESFLLMLGKRKGLYKLGDFANAADLLLKGIGFSNATNVVNSIKAGGDFCSEDENFTVVVYNSFEENNVGITGIYNLYVMPKYKYENKFKKKYYTSDDITEANPFYTKKIKNDTLFISESLGLFKNFTKVDSVIRIALSSNTVSVPYYHTTLYGAENTIKQYIGFEKVDTVSVPAVVGVLSDNNKVFEVIYKYVVKTVNETVKDIPTIKKQITDLLTGFGITPPAEILTHIGNYKKEEYFLKLYTVGNYNLRFKLINFPNNKHIYLSIASKGAIKG